MLNLSFLTIRRWELGTVTPSPGAIRRLLRLCRKLAKKNNSAAAEVLSHYEVTPPEVGVKTRAPRPSEQTRGENNV